MTTVYRPPDRIPLTREAVEGTLNTLDSRDDEYVMGNRVYWASLAAALLVAWDRLEAGGGLLARQEGDGR